MRKNERGFTLIELVIVVTILGILAIMIAPKLLGTPQQPAIQTHYTVIEYKGSEEIKHEDISDVWYGDEYVRFDEDGKTIRLYGNFKVIESTR